MRERASTDAMRGKGRRDVEVNDDVDNFLTALVLDILEIPKGYRGVSAMQERDVANQRVAV
jgi:hypothetical protein